MATDAQVETVVKTDLSWLKQHETIIIVLLFLLVGTFLFNKVLDRDAAKSQQAATIAAQQLTEARQETATATAAYQAALNLAQQQNVALSAAIASRQTVLVEQQAAVKTLPLPQVGQDIQTAIGGSGDVSAEVDGLKLNDSASRRVLSTLIQVPVLQADVADLGTELKSGQDALTAAQTVISSQVKTLAADDASCKAEVKAQIEADNKSKRKWFIIGFAAGIGTRILAHF